MPTKLNATASITSKGAVDKANLLKSIPESQQQTQEPKLLINGNEAMASSCIAGVRSAEELLALMKVDTDVWEISRQEVGMHEMGYKKETIRIDKNDEGRHTKTSTAGVQPLYSIKVWLKKKVRELFMRDTFHKMFDEFKIAKPLTNHVPRLVKDGLMLEVDIFDPHFGKLCWKPETGHNYDLKIASAQYAAALEGLLERSKGFKISKILFPVGNDFFHVDSASNTTTAGTPQDVDGRFQKSFIEGRKAMVSAIMRLLQIAPVEVQMVPGNHDYQTIFYLGEVLSGIFGKTKHVTINNAPTTRKYSKWGACLLGFTHGNIEKVASLPLIMATEEKEAWSKTRHREFHSGHWHKLKTISFVPVDEYNSIRVRILSSLTPPDAWHRAAGYEGLRSASAFVWDKEEGMIANLSYQAK